MLINEIIAARVNEIEKSNKTPWVVVVDNHVIGAESSRGAARTFNDALNVKGAISKYDASLIEFDETNVSDDVIEAVTTTVAEPIVSEPPTIKTKIDVLRLSTIVRPTKRVWAIADEMTKADANVKRKDIITRCVSEGIAFYTARTQYQQYFETLREQRTREATTANA